MRKGVYFVQCATTSSDKQEFPMKLYGPKHHYDSIGSCVGIGPLLLSKCQCDLKQIDTWEILLWLRFYGLYFCGVFLKLKTRNQINQICERAYFLCTMSFLPFGKMWHLSQIILLSWCELVTLVEDLLDIAFRISASRTPIRLCFSVLIYTENRLVYSFTSSLAHTQLATGQPN